jgi:hypothetical protein
MPDLLSETLIDFAAVGQRIPGRSGKRLNPTTVWRWSAQGVKAPDGRRVHLETIRAGGRTLTSVEAVGRFVAALTPRVEGTTPPTRTPNERRKASDRAAKELERMGA